MPASPKFPPSACNKQIAQIAAANMDFRQVVMEGIRFLHRPGRHLTEQAPIETMFADELHQVEAGRQKPNDVGAGRRTGDDR